MLSGPESRNPNQKSCTCICPKCKLRRALGRNPNTAVHADSIARTRQHRRYCSKSKQIDRVLVCRTEYVLSTKTIHSQFRRSVLARSRSYGVHKAHATEVAGRKHGTHEIVQVAKTQCMQTVEKQRDGSGADEATLNEMNACSFAGPSM